MKYYAVKVGRTPGIYETWDECREQIDKFNGAIYKSFSKKNEALAFLNGEESNINQSDAFAYVDGSYSPKSEEYSFGAVIVLNGNETRFKHKYEKDEYSTYRNVAGEIKGAGFIINYAINQGIKNLDLYYDYEGIHSWYVGLWRANTDISKKYSEFARKASKKIKINFIKVKSHSNVYYNEIVDKLAKEALGIE